MQNTHFLNKLKSITTFVFDVDGVFTDNRLIATEQGELLRTFNAKDGFALKTAIEKGYLVCIITGGNSKAVHARFKQLGVVHNHYNITDKLAVLEKFLSDTNTTAAEVLYIGDDIPDYASMNICGIKSCPADAVPEIAQIADYISTKNGGDGCVRELIEMVMKVQGKWFEFPLK